MIQGTGSDVGKSLLVAGLCRLARRRGIRVAPFKPQNMSNNAAVTTDGGEIGRAQALQAQAAGLEPEVDFNPVLLKPETDRRSQLIVHGRRTGTREARDWRASRDGLLTPVLESFERLTTRFDLVLVEGAGSPAEVNLRTRDIANMGFARTAGVPVVLVGDIDRGGVIAALVGTRAVLDPADAGMIKAFVVNRFRGDPALFDDGVRFIEDRTAWPCLGVVPWLAAAARLPAEDAVVLDRPDSHDTASADLRIVAPMLSRIANFDDADPLRQTSGVDFRFVPPGTALPRDADVVILFGTKSTIGDLDFIEAQGWHHDFHAHVRQGGRLLGLCGGYQMLGRAVHDPHGVDGPAGTRAGLGLLDIETTMRADKTVSPATGRCARSDARFSGYEIHNGRTTGPDTARPMLTLDGPLGGTVSDGARSLNGRVEGCYVHGLLDSGAYRDAWLQRVGGRTSDGDDQSRRVDRALDELADALERALDVDRLLALASWPTRA